MDATTHHHTDEQLDKLLSKLLANSTLDGTCVIWLGAADPNGYGRIRWNGKAELVHRMAWLVKTGSLPAFNVLHSCDNPPCWNGNHLFLGTQLDNVTDMHKKGRARKAFGEEASKAVLTIVQIQEIRVFLEKGYKYTEIGAKYGVCGESIRNIKTGRSWSHVR